MTSSSSWPVALETGSGPGRCSHSNQSSAEDALGPGENALEQQLRQSIASVHGGKPGTDALTPAPGRAAAQVSEQPTTTGNCSKPNGNGAAHNGSRPEQDIHQRWAQVLFVQTTALIDVYAAALHYAGTKHGNAVKPEDVKTLLTTAFINLSKQGGSHAA